MHRLPFLSLCLPPYKSARCTSPLCFSLSHWDFTPTCMGGGVAFSLLRQTPGVTRIVFQAITSKAEPWEGNERREVREWESEGQRTLNPSLRRLLVNSPPPHAIIESDGACAQPTTPCSGVRALSYAAICCTVISAPLRQEQDTQTLAIKLDQTTRVWLFSYGISTPPSLLLPLTSFAPLPPSRPHVAEDACGLIVTQQTCHLAAKSEPDEQKWLSNS